MKLQVLMSVMGQTDHGILEKANISSSAIVVNQAADFKYEKIKHRGKQVLFLTLPEKGVGLSRNTALMRADADIALMADDDVTYTEGYADKVIQAFENNPKADMIVFNVTSHNPDRPSYKIKKFGRVRRYNCLRYGTYRMAIRVDKIKQKNIYFSLLFGGGAKYSSGEDSIFIYSIIKSGLKVYRSPEIIGAVEQRESTWFQGYTDKFFFDKGALFKAMSPNIYPLLIMQFIVRKKHAIAKGYGYRELLKLMKKGAHEF